MRKLIERLNKRLQDFVLQRNNLALVVRCPDAEAAIVLKSTEGLDEESVSEFFWICPEEFANTKDYVATLITNFAARHEATRLSMQKEGMEPWPPLPPEVNSNQPGAAQLRGLMEFSRSLLPTEEGGLVVWALFPLRIQNHAEYGKLIAELLQHKVPFPWCHHLRIIVRDDKSNPTVASALTPAEHAEFYEPDLSQEAIQNSMEEAAADEDLPLDERIQSVQLLAGIDYAHKRYPEALEKYQLVLPYFAKTDNAVAAALALNGIGECHDRMGDPDSAESYYVAALEPAVECKTPPIPVLLNVMLNLANLTLLQKRWAESEQYYSSSEQLATAQLAPRVKIQSMENQGHCQYQQGKVKEALITWQSAATIARNVGESDLQKSILQRLRQHYVASMDRTKQREIEKELAMISQPAAPQS